VSEKFNINVGDVMRQIQETSQSPNLDLFSMPEIDFEAIEEHKQRTAGRFEANEVYDYLLAKVEAYQSHLKQDQELGIRLSNYGAAESLHVRRIDFCNPSLIIFEGLLPDGSEAELVQHVSQLNFLLVAVQPVGEEAPYRIGFELAK
jgi:hypothetical protein